MHLLQVFEGRQAVGTYVVQVVQMVQMVVEGGEEALAWLTSASSFR